MCVGRGRAEPPSLLIGCRPGGGSRDSRLAPLSPLARAARARAPWLRMVRAVRAAGLGWAGLWGARGRELPLTVVGGGGGGERGGDHLVGVAAVGEGAKEAGGSRQVWAERGSASAQLRS